jgi:ATP-dependent Zn protease
MNSKATIAIICAVLISVAGVLWIATTSQRSLTALTYSQFLEKVRTGQVASVIVMGSNSGAIQAICRLKDGNAERTVLPSDYRDAMVAMQDKLVNVEIRESSSGPLQLIMNATPFLLLLGVWIFLMIRKFPNGPGQSISWLASPRH